MRIIRYIYKIYKIWSKSWLIWHWPGYMLHVLEIKDVISPSERIDTAKKTYHEVWKKLKKIHLIHGKIEIAMQTFIWMYAVHINLMNHSRMSPNYIYALSGCTIIPTVTVCNRLILENNDSAKMTVYNVWVVLPAVIVPCILYLHLWRYANMYPSI